MNTSEGRVLENGMIKTEPSTTYFTLYFMVIKFKINHSRIHTEYYIYYDYMFSAPWP